MKTVSSIRCLAVFVSCLIAEETSFSQSIVWQQSSLGIGDTAWVTSFASNSHGQIFAGDGSAGLYRSSDDGLTWVPVALQPANLGTNDIVIDSSGWFFVASAIGVYRSTDNGVTWEKKAVMSNPLAGVDRIYIIHNGYIFAAMSNGGLYRSTDRGESWQSSSSKFGALNVTCFASDSKGEVLVGTRSVMGHGGLYISADTGSSWTGPLFNGTTILSTVLNSTGLLFVSAQNPSSFYRSSDGGQTWDTLATNALIYLLGVNSSDQLFGIAPRNPPDIGKYTGGVLRSTDKGGSWVSMNQGLPDTTAIISIFVAPKDYVFLGTSFHGIYRSSQRTTSVVSQSIVRAFSLGQNYPNPFNPSTTIRYELTNSAIVSLRIFNTLGQLVTTLVNEHNDAGSHQVQWRANVASGIYFYRLQAGEFVETKKMIVLR